jgi:DNA-binding transcriptional ArsR family regulator
MSENGDDSFNSSRAEVFEALGHPTRIRILQAVSERPLPFSELKHEVGLESNGLLSFHLGRLSGLVKLNYEGLYTVTDEGKEALRIIDSTKEGHEGRGEKRPTIRMPYGRALLACLVAAILILSLAAVVEQQQTNNLSRENDNSIASLQSALDSESAQIQSLNSTVVKIQSVTTTLTVTNTNESAYGPGPDLVPASIWLTAPGGRNMVTLEVSVWDNSNYPITNITVTFPTSFGSIFKDLDGHECMSSAFPCAVEFQTNGFPLGVSNALPAGSEISASIGLVPTAGSTVQAGTTYSFTVSTTFLDGSTNTQIVSVIAQL